MSSNMFANQRNQINTLKSLGRDAAEAAANPERASDPSFVQEKVAKTALAVSTAGLGGPAAVLTTAAMPGLKPQTGGSFSGLALPPKP